MVPVYGRCVSCAQKVLKKFNVWDGTGTGTTVITTTTTQLTVELRLVAQTVTDTDFNFTSLLSFFLTDFSKAQKRVVQTFIYGLKYWYIARTYFMLRRALLQGRNRWESWRALLLILHATKPLSRLPGTILALYLGLLLSLRRRFLRSTSPSY